METGVSANQPLMLALPKGRILRELTPLLGRAGIEPEPAFADETPEVPANGGMLDFILRVDIPAGTPRTTRSRIAVSAASVPGGALLDTVFDDAVVTIVRVYEQAAHVVNVNATPPCATVHALATGLPPAATGFRFVWRDGLGATVQVSDVATGSQGQCVSAHSLAPGSIGPGWSVDLQSWDGSSYVSLDVALFAVEDPVETSVFVENATHDRSGMPLVATVELANESFVLRPEALTLTWLVLSPDRTLYLETGGTFLPYSGVEATRVDQIPILERTTTLSSVLGIADVAYPSDGTYSVEAWVSYSCGPARLEAVTSFSVLDDPDGDGMPTADEVTAGTDPQDADTDDDGLTDGADGLGDADGDGLIDALDCDADGDGLVDGPG